MSYLEYYILVRLEPYLRAAWYSFSGFMAAQLAALIIKLRYVAAVWSIHFL